MRTYNIFVSHCWKYCEHYDRLTEFFDTMPYFRYKDYSVPKNDPIHNAKNAKELEAAIEKQMKYAHAVVIMAGIYASYSDWMQREIDIAIKLQKPIIAIRPRGQERLSDPVTSVAACVANWNSDSIVDAIKTWSLTS